MYLGRTKPTETTSSVLRSTYTGNGSTTTYALPGPVANETSIIATINGVTQQDAAYSTDGSNIIFDAAPASGDSIEIRTLSAVAMSYAPMAGSVVTGIIADGAVTTDKINNASVTGAKLGTGAAVANIGARAITAGQMPAGSVLQVLSSSFTSTQAISGSSVWTDISTLSISITPTSSNSKFLIFGTVYVDGTNNTYFRFVRNSTAIGIGDASGGVYRVTMGNGFVGSWSGNASQFMGFSNFHLDSPATASAITYKIQAVADGGSGTGTCYINYSNDESGNSAGRPISNITVMEIAA